MNEKEGQAYNKAIEMLKYIKHTLRASTMHQNQF